MIEKIEVQGNKYKVQSSFEKYAIKRIGKLDKYLPKNYKKGASAVIVVTEVNHAHNNKYEIHATITIPGGKIITAKDECSNVFAGIDIIESKLVGQIRRFKIEHTPHLRRFFTGKLFKKLH